VNKKILVEAKATLSREAARGQHEDQGRQLLPHRGVKWQKRLKVWNLRFSSRIHGKVLNSNGVLNLSSQGNRGKSRLLKDPFIPFFPHHPPKGKQDP
jgi:hypothetical protein